MLGSSPPRLVDAKAGLAGSRMLPCSVSALALALVCMAPNPAAAQEITQGGRGGNGSALPLPPTPGAVADGAAGGTGSTGALGGDGQAVTVPSADIFQTVTAGGGAGGGAAGGGAGGKG